MRRTAATRTGRSGAGKQSWRRLRGAELRARAGLKWRGAMLRPSGVAEAEGARPMDRSEEHTSELQSLMRISYAVFCLKKKKIIITRSKNETIRRRLRKH